MAGTQVTSEGSMVRQGSHPGFTTCHQCDFVRVTNSVSQFLHLQMIVTPKRAC